MSGIILEHTRPAGDRGAAISAARRRQARHQTRRGWPRAPETVDGNLGADMKRLDEFWGLSEPDTWRPRDGTTPVDYESARVEDLRTREVNLDTL